MQTEAYCKSCIAIYVLTIINITGVPQGCSLGPSYFCFYTNVPKL